MGDGGEVLKGMLGEGGGGWTDLEKDVGRRREQIREAARKRALASLGRSPHAPHPSTTPPPPPEPAPWGGGDYALERLREETPQSAPATLTASLEYPASTSEMLPAPLGYHRLESWDIDPDTASSAGERARQGGSAPAYPPSADASLTASLEYRPPASWERDPNRAPPVAAAVRPAPPGVPADPPAEDPPAEAPLRRWTVASAAVPPAAAAVAAVPAARGGGRAVVASDVAPAAVPTGRGGWRAGVAGPGGAGARASPGERLEGSEGRGGALPTPTVAAAAVASTDAPARADRTSSSSVLPLQNRTSSSSSRDRTVFADPQRPPDPPSFLPEAAERTVRVASHEMLEEGSLEGGSETLYVASQASTDAPARATGVAEAAATGGARFGSRSRDAGRRYSGDATIFADPRLFTVSPDERLEGGGASATGGETLPAAGVVGPMVKATGSEMLPAPSQNCIVAIRREPLTPQPPMPVPMAPPSHNPADPPGSVCSVGRGGRGGVVADPRLPLARAGVAEPGLGVVRTSTGERLQGLKGGSETLSAVASTGPRPSPRAGSEMPSHNPLVALGGPPRATPPTIPLPPTERDMPGATRTAHPTIILPDVLTAAAPPDDPFSLSPGSSPDARRVLSPRPFPSSTLQPLPGPSPRHSPLGLSVFD
ncbi:hypothetical protein T484DRAFT_1913706, partial [Baffinella frigidus]